jgi:mono/diheme cytochrome c family protein
MQARKWGWVVLASAGALFVDACTNHQGLAYDGSSEEDGGTASSSPNPVQGGVRGVSGGGTTYDASGPSIFGTGDDGNDGGFGNGPQPSFGVTQTLSRAPRPISGGTLLVTANGSTIVASDPDRDRIYVVEVNGFRVHTIVLADGDEPGRLVEDGSGHVHVVLRSGGAILTLDPAHASIVDRTATCAAPRGVALDALGDRLLVACDSGALLAMDIPQFGVTARKAVVRSSLLASLGQGLRDVVVSTPDDGDPTHVKIFVSKLRTAEVLELSADGTLASTSRPAASGIVTGFSFGFEAGADGGFMQGNFTGQGEATLAWRMIPALPGSGTTDPILVHQFTTLAAVQPSSGGYGQPSFGDDCSGGSIVRSAITQGGMSFLLPSQAVVPVDFVATPSGFAVVAAGNGHSGSLSQVFEVAPGPCGTGVMGHSLSGDGDGGVTPAQPVAIAAMPNGVLVVQSREPAALHFIFHADATKDAAIALASESREDTGHAIFHSNSGSGIACASCHGEGADDGHVWTFAVPEGGVATSVGPRRTPSLLGTIAGTAPYHWDGTMTDIDMLAEQVMTQRMNGPELSKSQKAALQSWLFALPRPTQEPAAMFASSTHGKALFESDTVGCTACHNGPRFTNNATVDVGTGGSFQVPSLIGVRARAPYLHDGCAQTLRDRFGSCGGTHHGNTAGLSPSDIDDLVAYLMTL